MISVTLLLGRPFFVDNKIKGGFVMDKVSMTLKVFFENPFWIGVFERIEDGHMSVSKIIFGNEPKDYEIYEFILKKYRQLQFSPHIQTTSPKIHVNPKQQMRKVKRESKNVSLGTKSQQALKLQHEQRKIVLTQKAKEQKKARAKQQFELKQQKKKRKHRGR